MIKRAKATDKGFSVNCNVILSGSKRMTPEEQEDGMMVDAVRLLIVDVDDPNNILVDEVLPAKEFKTKSVGYGLQVRGLHFSKEV